MRRKFKRNVKRLGILSSPVIIGAIMVLSMFAGPVAGTTTVSMSDEAVRYEHLIGTQGPPPYEMAVIGINMDTDTADTLTSILVELEDTSGTFVPPNDLSAVWLFKDNPMGVNGVYDSSDGPWIANAPVPVGGPVIWTTTITLPPGGDPIPVDDFWENEGNDYFIVIRSDCTVADHLETFKVRIPALGIVTNDNPGGLANSFTTLDITVDAQVPDLRQGTTSVLSVWSDIPGDPYLDDEDIYNDVVPDPDLGDDWVFYNDYPNEGNDQVVTIKISQFFDDNPYAFYGAAPYFEEEPKDYTLSAGPAYEITYKLTWGESDTDPNNGLNLDTPMELIVEDKVGLTSSYLGGANLHFVQDDTPPLTAVGLNNGATGIWYYDESLSGNYLPYVDEFNTINVWTTDDWWLPLPGAGFDKPTSYAQFRVGVERDSVETFWTQGWVDHQPGVNLPIQTNIVGDGNIGGDPYGYYFIEFDVQDDVGNNIRIGDGTFDIWDMAGGPTNYLDSNRIYFKIIRDYSRIYGGDITENGYGMLSTTEVYRQAAFSVSDLDIPVGYTLELYDTEIFIDSQFDGEKHVDVQGKLITGNVTNTLDYDDRSAFTRRGITVPLGFNPPFSGGPTDFQYTFWVRDGANLTMSDTVVEGCGFNAGDLTLDDAGLYIRTAPSNANIVSSEIRNGYYGVVIQDGGGVNIDDCDIWGNQRGVAIYYSPNYLPPNRNRIINSDIHNNWFYGITLDGSFAEIDNNDIYTNGIMGMIGTGIYMTSGGFGSTPPVYSMSWADITNNDIQNNDIRGVEIENSFYAPESAQTGDDAFYSGVGNNLDRNLTYSFDLSTLGSGDNATLTFWHWYNMGGDVNDGCNVLYYNRTWARWLPLIPVGSYDLANTPGYPYPGLPYNPPSPISGLDFQGGFAAHNELTYWTEDGWSQVEYDLSQFSGNGSVELKFRYGTNSVNYGTGWLIDDLAIPEADWTWDGTTTDWTLNGWELLDVTSFSSTETVIQNNNISQNGAAPMMGDPSNQGIYAQYSDVDIMDNTIWDNGAAGMMVIDIDAGIHLEYFVDALIDNNVVDDNRDENIKMNDWVEADVINNEITDSDNEEGLHIQNYCRVLIDNNYIAENDEDGIYAYYFCDLIITNNDISYNGGEGMDLEGYGLYYYVENNVVTYNDAYGIYAYEAYGLIRSPYEGSNFYWAQGQYAYSNEYLTYDFNLGSVLSANLTFQHAYNTETWCDGGFVEYWDASSGMWEMLYPNEGYINPYINGDGNGPNAGQYYGYEGYSMGWRTATFNLDMLVGGWARIRFHYATDVSVTYGGWAIDNIEIEAIGFFDGAESAIPPTEQIMNHGFLTSSGRWNYILNNIFSNNDDDCLYLEETYVDVENNVITFNDGYGIYVYDYCYAYIDNNEITFNDDYGVYIEEYCYVELTNNNISYNYYGIYIYDYCQVIIDYNIIEYTYDQDDDAVISVEDYCYVEITNNYIAYNNKDFWYYAIYLDGTENSFIIRDNIIIENGYGIYLESTYVTPPPSGSYAWHTQNSVYRGPMILERSFNLGALALGDTATLTFWHWYDIGSDAGGCVQVYNSSSNSWETINPIDDHSYDSSNIDRLFDSAGYGDSDDSWSYEWNVFYETYTSTYTWDGCDDGWIFAEFDLSPWAGDTDVQVRWLYTEYDSIYAGWFIDDVAIPEIGFLSDAEDMLGDNSMWTADGWSRHIPAGLIENNDIKNNLGYGIEMNDDSYPDIINNRITGNGYNGIYIGSQFGDQYDYIRPAAPSGTHMWYSGYSNYADFYLYRQFNLANYQEVVLTFYHWYYSQNYYDGGVVEVYSNGQWLKAEPRGTYPDEFYYGGEGYCNEDEYEWYYAHFDLSKYAGQTITLRFRFMTDDSDLYTGWYIDDITLTGDRTVFYYDDMENPQASYMDWSTGGSNIVDNRYGPPKGWSIMETNAIIIGGNDISYNGYEQYAGIYFDDYVNAILDDNDINHNGEEGNWGPGLYAYEDSTLSVRNNRIRHNAWGGVYAYGYVYGVWQNNLITHNYGTEEDYTSGHGVYFYDYCSGIFVNNYIADNQHAGMYLEYGDYVIKGNTITNNHWQGIHLYECGYYYWNHPVYLEDNEITANYMFDRLDGYEDDEWSGCGLFVESSDSYVHVFNGVYSNNERYGIFVTDSVSEFQWIIDHEAEAENNGMRIYGGDYYVEEEFGGGEIYPVLVADGGYLTLKNVRDFQTWLLNDDEWYGIEVETGGTLDARDTTFDSWYDEYINPWDYDIPHYMWSFRLPFPGMDDDYYDYGQFDDNDLLFSGGDSAIIFATEIEWGRSWTAAGEYQVNYLTGEVVISSFTLEGTGPTSMTYDYTSKRPLPYTFRVFGNLHMDDCKVVNTTSVYLETSGSVEIYSTEFTDDLHGGVSSINSNPIISDCWFHDIDFGIFAEGGMLTIGGGNLFEDNEDAIQLTEWSTATIYGNTFMDNIRGITVYDSPDLTITDNYIDNCADDGMHIVNSFAIITGNSISNCDDKAIYLRSTTAIMSMNTLTDNFFSVYASDTYLMMTSDSIAGSTLEDIYSEDNSDVTALDISFDREEVLMVVDNSLIEIQWYTIVEVLGMNGGPLEDADVDVDDSTPSQQQTDANGLTPQFVTTEYIQYASSQDDRKPHTITAECNVTGTIYTGMLSVGITDSGIYTIILNNGPDIQLPEIGDVAFDEDTILYSAFDLDSLFEDDGGDEGMTYWWIGNVRVVITPNPDNVVDLTAASNWNGMEVVVFYASDMWGETISQSINITVNPVNDPPLATDVKIEPVSPDNMDDLASSYVWYDNVEAEDLEEGSIITWYKSTDGGVNYGKVEEFDGEIVVPFTATSWGEMWYFTVRPGDDNGGLGDEVASNIVYIIRIIPEIYFDDVSIDGDPTETGELTAALINPQGDTSQTQYQWYRNGELIDGATLDTLSSDYYDEGDTITASATPFDGYNEGDPVMSSEGVVIMNSPPSLEGVVISPQHPTLVDDLAATPIGYSDPDSRDYTTYENNTNYYHMYYVFEWRVNGEVIPGVTGDTLDYAHFDVGDVVNVTVTPSDGEDFGASVTSESVTIGEAEPESDFDGDGIPDETDIDNDNDGVPDINDVFPFDAKEWSDFDGDGIGDNADEDDDNDGFPDGLDFAPKDRDVQWQPWIWLVILILILLLLMLAYFKWWRPPREPKVKEESREEYSPPEEEEPFEGETEAEEDIAPPEEPTTEDVASDIDKEIAALTGEETGLTEDSETGNEPEDEPKKRRRKRKAEEE